MLVFEDVLTVKLFFFVSVSAREVSVCQRLRGKEESLNRTVSTLNLLLGGTAFIHALMLDQMILERIQSSCGEIKTHDPRISCKYYKIMKFLTEMWDPKR